MMNESEGPPAQKEIKFCCQKCIKNKVTGRSCLCIVPKDQRRHTLGQEGCRNCSCSGCFNENMVKKKRYRSRSRSRSNSIHSQDSNSSNYENFKNSFLINMISKEWKIPSSLLGFGIPERTKRYINGKV